jgi:hypothetical protein
MDVLYPIRNVAVYAAANTLVVKEIFAVQRLGRRVTTGVRKIIYIGWRVELNDVEVIPYLSDFIFGVGYSKALNFSFCIFGNISRVLKGAIPFAARSDNDANCVISKINRPLDLLDSG